MFSGQIIDEEQVTGYGPAQYYNGSEQVKVLNNELHNISTESFKVKYSGMKVNEASIYPVGREEAESLDYVLDNFEQL